MTKLSVVVSTYNRAQTLANSLNHLGDQSLEADLYEVIVVDDGSSDHTERVVEKVRSQVPYEMKYLHHSNRGPGFTHNRGIREAQSPIVLLMADDIFMTRQALQVHLEAHQENPNPEVSILGNVVQSPSLNQSVFLRKWKPFRLHVFSDRQEVPYYMFWACNISFKRDFIIDRAMFREKIGRAGPASHEDVELGYRLSRHGLRILFCKEALGYHHHVTTLELIQKRYFERGLNFSEMRSLIPEPEISVRYHVLCWHTLHDHFRALTGPRRTLLPKEDRNVLLLLQNYLFRLIVFNRITVPLLWMPIMKRAERSRPLAKIMHGTFYRGVLSYSNCRGYRRGREKYGV